MGNECGYKTRRRLSWQDLNNKENITPTFLFFYPCSTSFVLVLAFWAWACYFLYLLSERAGHFLALGTTFYTVLHSSVQENKEDLSLPSLDWTNGYEIQSNSRYFRSTARHNRKSDRSNLSAH